MRQIREKVVQLQYERRLTQLENTHQKISRREKKLTADRDGVRFAYCTVNIFITNNGEVIDTEFTGATQCH